MKRLSFVLLLILLCMELSAKQNYYLGKHFEFSFDGVPALADTVNNILYISINPDTEDDFKSNVTVTYFGCDSTDFDLQVALGSGSMHELPHRYNIKQWPTKDNVFHVSVNNSVTDWKMVFSTLPFVNLSVKLTDLKNMYAEDESAKIDARIRIIDPLSRLNGGNTDFDHFIGIKIRGQHSSDFGKKPYAVEIRNEITGEEENVNLFNIREDGDWVLDAMYVDPARMRNRALTDIWNSISDLPYEKNNEYQANGSSGVHVELFIRNEYKGLYCFTDKIDRKKLNLKKTEDNGDGTQTIRGIVYRGRYSSEATTLYDYDDSEPTDSLMWNSWEQEYPSEPALANWGLLKEFISVVGDGDHSGSSKRLKNEFNEWLYMDNCVDFFIFLNAFYLIENTNKNYYLSFQNLKKGHRALFTLWDMDASLGRNGSGEEKFDETSRYGFNSSMKKRICLFNRLMSDNTLHFTNRIRSRWDVLKQDQLSVENISKRLNKYAKLLLHSGAMAREQEKWAKSAAPDLQAEVDRMIEWYKWNFNKMDSVITSFKPYEGQDDPDPTVPDEKNIAGYSVRPSNVLVNDVPVVADKTSKTIYVSILMEKGAKKTPIKVTSTMPDVVFSLDGSDFASEVTGAIKNCNETTHKLVVDNGVSKSEWKMEFTTLPVICVDTDWKLLLKNMINDPETKIDGYLYIVDAKQQTDGETVYAHRIATRVRGASAKDYDKKSLAVEIRDEQSGETTKDARIFGIRKDDDWILDAMYIDHARMRNRALTDIWNTIDDLPYEKEKDTQFNGTHGQHVEVIINGEYAGMYCLTDKVDRKKLNLQKSEVLGENETIVKGILYKGKKWTDATMLHKYNDMDEGENSLMWQGWEQQYPDDDNTLTTWDVMRDFIEVSGDENGNNKYARLPREYQDYFYLDNMINYWVFFNAVALLDNTMKNTFLSNRDITSTKQMLFTPWDLDGSLGRDPYGVDVTNNADYYAFGKKLFNRCGLFNRLMLDDSFHFHRLVRTKWETLKKKQLSLANVMNVFDGYADILTNSGAWRREYLRWPEHVVENVQDEVDFIRRFYAKNMETFDEYVKDYSIDTEIDDIFMDGNQLAAYSQNGRLYITGGSPDGTLVVTDMTGRTVAQFPAGTQTIQLPTGIYVVASVRHGAVLDSTKILVQ